MVQSPQKHTTTHNRRSPHSHPHNPFPLFVSRDIDCLANYNYLYFLKCVSTHYHYLSSRPPFQTHQYSTTFHSRPLSGGKDPDHNSAVHSRGGVPGVFFVYDISPMRVIKREERGNSLGGFLAAVVGGVGGVLVLAGWIDRGVWEVERGLRKKIQEGKTL
jgi:endoplasmic reticulum-Golgi intermediate compartment protein 3